MSVRSVLSERRIGVAFGAGYRRTFETGSQHPYCRLTVTLTTAVGTETDTLTRTSYITVSAGGCVSPTAGFSGSPLTGTAPLTVSFTDASSGTVSGRWWSFGDGAAAARRTPATATPRRGCIPCR